MESELPTLIKNPLSNVIDLQSALKPVDYFVQVAPWLFEIITERSGELLLDTAINNPFPKVSPEYCIIHFYIKIWNF